MPQKLSFFYQNVKRNIIVVYEAKKIIGLFPAHQPGEIYFDHQPAARLNIFFLPSL